MKDPQQSRDRSENARPQGAGVDAGSVAGVREWHEGSVFFPSVLEATADAPLFLGRALGADNDDLSIVEIDGVAIDPNSPSPLPGIRVGAGEGSGFVLRRALDGELVFVPNADFTGMTTLTCKITDKSGDQASFVAVVNVRAEADEAPEVAFADGSRFARVTEGTDGAIVGALAVLGLDGSEALQFRVYEAGSDQPSVRFSVTGDRLQALAPLDATVDSKIMLRIVASDGGWEIGAGEIELEVRAAEDAAGRGGLPAAMDQFHFAPRDEDRAQFSFRAMEQQGAAAVNENPMPSTEGNAADAGLASVGAPLQGDVPFSD